MQSSSARRERSERSFSLLNAGKSAWMLAAELCVISSLHRLDLNANLCETQAYSCCLQSPPPHLIPHPSLAQLICAIFVARYAVMKASAPLSFISIYGSIYITMPRACVQIWGNLSSYEWTEEGREGLDSWYQFGLCQMWDMWNEISPTYCLPLRWRTDILQSKQKLCWNSPTWSLLWPKSRNVKKMNN